MIRPRTSADLPAVEAAVASGPVVLTTDTIAAWVQRRGYRRGALGDGPASVRTTTQFEGSLCASTSIYLKETP